MSATIGLDPHGVSTTALFGVNSFGEQEDKAFVYVKFNTAVGEKGEVCVIANDGLAHPLSTSTDLIGRRVGIAPDIVPINSYCWLLVRGEAQFLVAANCAAHTALRATAVGGVVDDSGSGPVIEGIVNTVAGGSMQGLVDGRLLHPTLQEQGAGGGGGITESEADARYLQLTGGTLTSTLTVTPATNAVALLLDARALTTQTPFVFAMNASGNQQAFWIRRGTDAQAFFTIDGNIGGGNANPGIALGPGGSTTRDVLLYRGGGNILETPDAFRAATLDLGSGSLIGQTAAQRLATTQTNLGIKPIPDLTTTDSSKHVTVNAGGTALELTDPPSGTVTLSDNVPVVEGTAIAGTSTEVSRSDHVHPSGGGGGGGLDIAALTALDGSALAAGDGLVVYDLANTENKKITPAELFQGLMLRNTVKMNPASVGGSDQFALLDHSASEIRHLEWTDLQGLILSDAVPIVEGSAIAGVATAASRADHVHPSGGGGGSVTLSDTIPIEPTGIVGLAGTATEVSRQDHVHPDRYTAVTTWTRTGDFEDGNLYQTGITLDTSYTWFHFCLNVSGSSGPRQLEYKRMLISEWTALTVDDAC